MKFSKESNNSNVNPISELYPKSSYVKDESTGTETYTLTEPLKSISLTEVSIQSRDGKDSINFKLNKTNSVGDSKDYYFSIQDFFRFNFKSEEAKQKSFNINFNNIINLFKEFGHELSSETLDLDFNSITEIVEAINSEVKYPLSNPDLYLKLVFKNETGVDKPKYVVSKHFPIVSKNPKFKYKTGDAYSPDILTYVKKEAEPDDLLGGSSDIDDLLG